jgi:uncharacterized protein YqfB (UPF0267 family)
MPAINFQPQFVDLIRKGEKKQTIRRKRKIQIKAGDKLFLYTGMRTKNCQKIIEADCKSVQEVKIDSAGIKSKWYPNMDAYMIHSPDFFAKQDGFNNWEEMRDWFDNRYGLPFRGVVIKW